MVDVLSYRTSFRLNNLHLFDPHSIPVTLCIVFGLIIVFFIPVFNPKAELQTRAGINVIKLFGVLYLRIFVIR
jgi:hypothetical protein